jgi:hypothetical protein
MFCSFVDNSELWFGVVSLPDSNLEVDSINGPSCSSKKYIDSEDSFCFAMLHYAVAPDADD